MLILIENINGQNNEILYTDDVNERGKFRRNRFIDFSKPI